MDTQAINALKKLIQHTNEVLDYDYGICSKIEAIIKTIEQNKDYAMLTRENKAMAEALSKLGYTNEQISDIANGAI